MRPGPQSLSAYQLLSLRSFQIIELQSEELLVDGNNDQTSHDAIGQVLPDRQILILLKVRNLQATAVDIHFSDHPFHGMGQLGGSRHIAAALITIFSNNNSLSNS